MRDLSLSFYPSQFCIEIIVSFLAIEDAEGTRDVMFYLQDETFSIASIAEFYDEERPSVPETFASRRILCGIADLLVEKELDIGAELPQLFDVAGRREYTHASRKSSRCSNGYPVISRNSFGRSG